MKKKEQPSFRSLLVPSNEFSFFRSLDVLEDLTLGNGKWAICPIIECKVSDLSFHPENGTISVERQELQLTIQGAKELCKILKIPYSFSTSIPIDLLETNIEQLKGVRDQEIKVVVNNGNKIVNITKKKTYADRYYEQLVGWLQNQDKMDFVVGQISDCGYLLFFVDREHTLEGFAKDEYLCGQCFVGDFYRIHDDIELRSAIFKDESFATFDSFAPSPKFKITSNKLVELGDDWTTTLLDMIGQDFAVGMQLLSIQDILRKAKTNNLSYYRFFQVYPKLKRFLSGSDVLAQQIFGIEEVDFNLYREDVDSLQNSTPPLDLGKRLATTSVEKINTLLSFNNLMKEMENLEVSDFETINEIACSLLFDTYQCEPTIQKRLGEGIILK